MGNQDAVKVFKRSAGSVVFKEAVGAAANPLFGVAADYAAPTVVDFDGDGDQDVVVRAQQPRTAPPVGGGLLVARRRQTASPFLVSFGGLSLMALPPTATRVRCSGLPVLAVGIALPQCGRAGGVFVRLIITGPCCIPALCWLLVVTHRR